ncbi:MAG: carbohydrate ABC transporter permease [Cellulosilyticaceae bacterium]
MNEKIAVRAKRIKSEGMEPYLYLLPSLVLFGTFVYFPFLKTIYLSLSMTNVRGKVIEFVGFENYKEVLTSPEFMNSILITFKFVLLVGVPSILLGLILALLANVKMKGSRVYELMFSAPMAIASAPAAIVWMMIFHPTNGILNYLMQKEVGWLTDPKIAILAVALVTVWLNLGVNFIFLLTGLRNIPEELVESASVDGANYIQKLLKVILPMLSPQLFFVLFMNLISSFQAFGQIKLLTQGGPGDSTNVIVHSIYREAFFNGRFEIACVQSLVLFIIMLAFTLIQFKFEQKGVHYQ